MPAHNRDGHPWVGDIYEELERLRVENEKLRAENERLRRQATEPDWSLD
jgi:regulator of replication initiation timing